MDFIARVRTKVVYNGIGTKLHLLNEWDLFLGPIPLMFNLNKLSIKVMEPKNFSIGQKMLGDRWQR